ncbi:hypothetical protein HYH03_013794 [Edaphochlamys debaryana]|uniref:EF-hand domain-containing protein n=1 Tax=Edaphochlamys debaryana TaxID=47281 RepID=A0A835XQE7_9CHLO|nr:hypothetical protein HYH03_013794 [Edaphochlamys debaryana]|eukprot:KAG2487657.1 hypothetical protein HYH03_013794 [Edaphochlamys debaryana]
MPSFKLFGKKFSLPGLPGFPPNGGLNFTASNFFKDQARKAFDECDIDRDGQLDTKEVYVGLLKLYDLLNRKLPYHIKVPKIGDINSLMDKYDGNSNRHLDFPEFLELCKGLVGTKKNWRDSLFLKIGIAVVMKALGFPYLAGLIKTGVEATGLKGIEGVPVGAITYMLESASKQLV